MERVKRGIYKRQGADGGTVYYIRVTLGGKQTWRRAGDTLTAAREFQRAVKEGRAREALGVELPKKIVFRELVEKYVADYTLRKGEENLARIRSSMKKLNSYFGNALASSIREEAIDGAHLPRADAIMMRVVLRAGRRWGYIQQPPDVRVPRAAKRLDRSLSIDQLRLALEQASPNHRDAIALSLYLGGMRLGELTKITAANTDFDARTIDIVKRKADQPKRFMLTEPAAAILRRRFLANGGRAFVEAPQKLSQRFHYERRKMQGLRPFRFHDLRHSLRPLLPHADTETFQELLGHSDIKMTQRYLHSTEQKQRAALAKVAAKVKKIAKG